MKKVFIFIISIFIQHSLYAQTDSCTIKLKNADAAYEDGDYDHSISLLNSSLAGCKLSKEEKIQVHKLLILSYLKIDNLEAADRHAAEIMRIDPYYKPDKFKDDIKLTELFAKYEARPLLRAGIYFGINSSIASADQTYSIVHSDNSSDATYKQQTGIQIGAFAEYSIYKIFWLEGGFRFRTSKYAHILNNVETTSINYSEKLTIYEAPLFIKAYFMKGRFNPYVKAGATFSYLTYALSTSSRDNIQDLVDRTDYRNKFGVGYGGGIGAAYSFKEIMIHLEVNYNYYPSDVNKSGTRYDDAVNVFKYYYIDDDFRIDNMQVSAGIAYTFKYKNIKVSE